MGVGVDQLAQMPNPYLQTYKFDPNAYGVPQYGQMNPFQQQQQIGQNLAGAQQYQQGLQSMMPNAPTASSVIGNALDASGALPSDLQITGPNAQLNPQDRQRWENNYMQQYINPQIGQTQADLFAGGRADTSFGGAQLGQLQAMGRLQSMGAGEELMQNRLNQLISRRASFFGNEGQMGQNQANTQFNRNSQIGLGAFQQSIGDNTGFNNFQMQRYNAGLNAQGNLQNQQTAGLARTSFNYSDMANRTQAGMRGGYQALGGVNY